MTRYCPRCGHNVEADPAMVRGDWRICLEQGVRWRRIEIALTGRQLSVLHSLASCPGRFLGPYVLLARAGSATAGAEPRAAAVAVSSTRREIISRIKAAGAPVPIDGRRGMGARWIGSADRDIRPGGAG